MNEAARDFHCQVPHFFVFSLLCYSGWVQAGSVHTVLLWLSRTGVWLLLLTPCVMTGSLFVPYVTGKNFFFRIVVELGLGLWLALALVDRRYRPGAGAVLWALTAFIGVLLAATLCGVHPYQSFWSNYARMEGVVTYLHLFALFLIASSVFHTKREWSMVLHVSLGVSVLISLYGVLEKIGVLVPTGAWEGRVCSRLGNPMYLAAYLLFHFFLLTLLWSWTQNIRARVAYALIGIVEVYIFLSTGTRGAVLGLVAGVGVVLVLSALFSAQKKARMISVGVLVLAVIGALGLFQLKNSSFVHESTLLARLTDMSPISSAGFSRVTVWRMAWEAFQERPFLGWGPGNFMVPYAKYYNPDLFSHESWFDHVHNMPLEWLVTGGILGFLLYAHVFAASFCVLWRLWRRGVLGVLEMSLLAGCLVAYLIQDTFAFDTISSSLLLLLLFAFLHAMDRLGRKPQVEEPPPVLCSPGYAIWPVPVLLVGALLLVYGVNAAPLRTAMDIRTMLHAADRGAPPGVVIAKLDKIVAEGTFGVTEAREQFVDLVIQSSRNLHTAGQPGFLLLLDKAITEMEQEVQDTPPTMARALIPLGKLYQLRFAITGDHQDRERSLATYKHAIVFAPHYPLLYLGMAETYLSAGDFHQACETADTIFRKVTHPNTLVYAALLVSVRSGSFDRAIEQIAY